eukprot:gene14607-10444_t
MVQDNRQRRHRANASSGNNDRHVSNAGAVDSASVEASTANDSSALITHQEEQTLPETQPLELPREAHGSDIDFDLLAADIPHIENFGPGMRCPVVVNSTDAGYEISNMVWGMIPTYFPADEKGNHFQLFNKRIEGLASGGEETAGKYFMQLMKTKRCVAVFDGFYEWKVIAGKKQPYYVHFSNNEPLLMAGIYEDSDYVDYHDMKPIHTRTFAILTGGSCAEFEIVHTRQPIFLTSKQAERWLDDSLSVTELDQLLEELRLAPTIADTDFNSWLKFYPVTKKLTDMKFQQNIPLKVHVNLSKKALDEAKGNYDASVTRPSPAEVEILQKVIVRERLLGELTRLVRSGSDMLSVMGEVVELIKAIRFETVDIVEDISNWQAFQPTPRPFLYKGMNYLIKISCDFDFLDNYDEVVEKFCFEFKSNPFAYKGGGNVITGAGPKNSDRYLQGLLNSYYEGGHINIDGVEVARLHNAEKIIQGEFNRLAEQGNINLGVSQAKIPDALQIKLERISTLQGEVDELMAVMSHITEKIKTLTTDYQDRIKMYRAIESKMIDARNAGKEAAAQHCTADLIVRKAALVELTNKVKELQREHYFVGLEKKRKQGVIRTMQTELDEEKRKVALKKKIEEVIKTKGLAAALDLINLQKEEQQQFASKALSTTGSGKTVAVEDVPNSARSSRSKQLSGQKVGYISDEEEGDEGEDDDEDDDLEVSADASTAPAGSGFQLAKALKMSPRLS